MCDWKSVAEAVSILCCFAFIYVDKLSFVDLMLSLEYVSSHYYFFVSSLEARVALALAIQQEFYCDNANNDATTKWE